MCVVCVCYFWMLLFNVVLGLVGLEVVLLCYGEMFWVSVMFLGMCYVLVFVFVGVDGIVVVEMFIVVLFEYEFVIFG